MARLPLYEQQTTAGQVRASGQAFGADVAQAQQQAAGVMMDIGTQMKRRADVIERVQLLTDFDKFATDSLTALNDTEDISKPATVDKYAAGLREKANEVLSNHRGTGASRAELQAQVENQVGQYLKSATAAQIKAQQTFIGQRVDQAATELAITAGFAPDKMPDVFAEYDRRVEALGDAISPTQQAQFKEAGRSRIATVALQQLLQTGNWAAAKAALENPEVGKYLQPDAARSLTLAVTVDQRKAELEVERQNRNVANWTARLGRNLTPEEQIKVRQLPEKKDMTVADQIVEYELVTGKPAPPSVVDQFYKVEGAGGGTSMFGNSLQGRALSYVTENAVAYANGMLTAEQARVFEASYAEAYKPVMRPNPVTGQMEEVRPTIPPFAQQAMDQGARVYGGGATTRPSAGGNAAMPGQQIMVTLPDGRRLGPATVDANGNWTVTDTAAPAPESSGLPAAGGQPSQDVASMPLVDLAPYLTGVSSGIGRAVSDIPLGIGDTFGNPIYAQAAQRAKNMIEAVTNASKPETKIAEQYRQELRDLVDLGTKSFGSELAYHARAVEIDRELRRKLSEVEKKIDGAMPTTLQERKAAIEIRNDILAVLPEIGVPQKVVKTRKEVEALPSGTRFRFGDDPTPRTRK